MLLLLLLLCGDVAAPSVTAPPTPTATVEAPAPRRAPSTPLSPTSSTPTTISPTTKATTSPRLTTPLMARFAGRLVAAASSTWPEWPADRIIDGDPTTSWFSEHGDAAALGKTPWVSVTFPVDVTVKKVTILGNREPDWATGFTIHYGRLELLDDRGVVLARVENEGRNTLADIGFTLKAPVARVRTVRFTSLLDDGDKTGFADIALAELLVEEATVARKTP